MRDGEQIDDIAQRALVAALDAELVAAPQAQQQIPSPLERQVRSRHERTVSLVTLAELVTELDVALQLRCLRGIGSEQSVREKEIHENAGFESAKRSLDQRADLRRRAAATAPHGRISVLEVRRIELADAVVAQTCEVADRAGARLVPDHSQSELELGLLSTVTKVRGTHICLSLLMIQICRLRLTLPLMVF